MSTPFIGRISVFPFGFLPAGWATCDGQLLPVSQNLSLFSLLGTTYGGDGVTTFALPNLQGRIPIHASPMHPRGEAEGEEMVLLTISQTPAHTHAASASSAPGTALSPQSSYWAQDPLGNTTFSGVAGVTLAADAIGNAGTGAAHGNLAPFQVLNFCIALQGIYPISSDRES